MKRLITVTATIILIAITVQARQPQRGYRGFIEWSNDLRSERFYGFDKRESTLYKGITTSHGYQINQMFFAGMGIGLEKCGKWDNWIAPIFLQGRADFKWGRFTPFCDLRAGVNISEGVGAYFSPTIGYRFNWGRKMGVNVGVGLSVAGYKCDYYDVTISPDGYFTMEHIGIDHRTRPYFSFRIGFDF